MKIALFLSNFGGSPLVVGLHRGLAQLGHAVEQYRHGHGYDLVLVFNMCAHVTNYAYPAFPPPGLPIAFIDTAEYGYGKRYPDIAHEYANTFSPGSMAHDTKNRHEQTRLRQFLEGRSFPYLLREFSKYVTFPEGYHCVDYPLYFLSEEPVAPNREEYLARQQDLFVSWGASHPWRLPITEALRGCGVKGEIHVLEQNGAVRMHQPTYFRLTKEARVSVSADGYGSASFRMTEVLVRCLLLNGPLSIHMRAPLVDRVTCREYHIEANRENFVSTDICEILKSALADPIGSYEIYSRGYDHAMTHLTERATAKYVLEVVAGHNWSVPTQLTIDSQAKPN